MAIVMTFVNHELVDDLDFRVLCNAKPDIHC